jgi:RNA polymerase sigma factor (sigma-70 family)
VNLENYKDSQSSLTACELITECAKRLQDAALWEEFYCRYKRKIVTYLWRAFRMSSGNSRDFVSHADDWVQEVFTKLLQNDGRIVRSFRGTTDVSVNAFLASIAVSIVSDQLRAHRAIRRRCQLVQFENVPEIQMPRTNTDSNVSALLDLLDLEKALKGDDQCKNPERDFLIFKLHFVEGLTAKEIAQIPRFNLTISGLEKVLNRLRSRLTSKKAAS